MTPRVAQMGLGAFSLLFFAFIYAPLLIIIVYSFNSNPVNMMLWDHFTLEWYTGLFGLSERGPEIGDRTGRSIWKAPTRCFTRCEPR